MSWVEEGDLVTKKARSWSVWTVIPWDGPERTGPVSSGPGPGSLPEPVKRRHRGTEKQLQLAVQIGPGQTWKMSRQPYTRMDADYQRTLRAGSSRSRVPVLCGCPEGAWLPKAALDNSRSNLEISPSKLPKPKTEQRRNRLPRPRPEWTRPRGGPWKQIDTTLDKCVSLTLTCGRSGDNGYVRVQ